MTLSNERTIFILNELIEICQEAERGFREAAAHWPGAEPHEMFKQFAEQRRQGAEDLKALVVEVGGEQALVSQPVTGVCRGWVNIKAVCYRQEAREIIEEAERSESLAVNCFQEALARDLPGQVQPVVQKIYDQIRDAYEAIRQLDRDPHHFRLSA